MVALTIPLKCISPSLPLLNTWVTINAQEGFCDALHAERACQTGLLAQTLATQDNHPYERNIALEFLILHAKMRRAQAETDLYTMAIEHAREFDFSDNISGHQLFFLALLTDLCRCNVISRSIYVTAFT